MKKMTSQNPMGCAAAFGVMVSGTIIGALIPSVGAYLGFMASGAIVVVLYSLSRSRRCGICGAPIRQISYTAEVNGKLVKIICEKCKDALTAEVRREALKDL